MSKEFAPFENVFAKRMLLKSLSNLSENVKILESFARKCLKVKVNYGGNIDIATLFTEALIDLKKEGYRLPSEIVYGDMGKTEIAKRQMDHRTIFTYWKSKIFINPNHDFSCIEEEMDMTNKSPKHPIFHEVGHMLHKTRFSTLIKSLFWTADLRLPCNERILIHSEVGPYATTDIAEFVAEVFAGHMSGKRYSKDILDLYCKYNGIPFANKQ